MLATNYISPLCYRSLLCVQPPPLHRTNWRKGVCDSPSPIFSEGRGRPYTGYSRQSSKRRCLVPRPYYSARPMRFGSRGPSESPMWIAPSGYFTKDNVGEYFSGTGVGTGALLITIPFLCKGPRLTYKVRSRVTVICKFFMASLFKRAC